MSLAEKLSVAADRLLCAFFPRRCAYCGKLIVPERTVCEECTANLPRITAPVCSFCGCAKADCTCKQKKLKFDAVCAPFYYEKSIERAVHRFKFEDKDFLARPFAQEIALAVHRDFAQQPFDVVTFIPFTRGQARSRAFNPSELLARETAKVLALPCVPLLEKLFETETQHHLSQTARTGNVFGVYEVKDAAAVQDKHILLVDDIKTTGATLSECAKVLKLAGASSVHAAVFAVAKKKKGKTAHGSSGSGENTGSDKGL